MWLALRLIAVRCRLAEGEGKRIVSLDGSSFTFLKCAFKEVIVRGHKGSLDIGYPCMCLPDVLF